jgi:ankyrin repeat protein
LIVAAQLGHTHVFEALIEGKARLEEVDGEGDMALYDAVTHGQTASALALLKLKADVNAVDPKGFTPLYAAAWRKNAALAMILVAHGAALQPAAGEVRHSCCLQLAAGFSLSFLSLLS